MQNLNESIENLNKSTIEMIKNVDSMFKIMLQMLKMNNFDKKLYGEAKVIEEEINDYQLKVDEKCINIIARYQPTAKYLRNVVGIMHMNVDLERIGDLCISIMKTIKVLQNAGDSGKEMVPIYKMGEKVMKMYEMFVTGYIEQDIDTGYKILGLKE